MTHGEAEVPQGIQKGAQKPLVVSADRIGEEHQQIDVRVKTQLAAAVPAKGEHPDGLRGRPRIRKNLLDDGVHAMRVVPERHASAIAAFAGLTQLATCRLEALASNAASLESRIDRYCRRFSHAG